MSQFGVVNGVTVRAENETDHDAVREIHRAAFSGEVEANLVDALRRSGAVAISLVAERAGTALGHILFSPLSAPMRALALAPVGVLPDSQGHGIGSLLIREGIERARGEGWAAVFVVGEPEYYKRFGFSVEEARGYSSPYSGDYLMVLVLAPPVPVGGDIVYPAPFSDLES